MNKLMEIVHPEMDHFLEFEEGSESVALSQTCHKCQPVSRNYYKCTQQSRGLRCGYYLHKECAELKDLPQFHHPLHPQHPLVEHQNYHCDKSFVCSFCGETKQSREFYQCSEDHCDFYLDTTCVDDFIMRPELLDKYEIQHVLHRHENHRLSPHNITDTEVCAGCINIINKGSSVYKCIECRFYLHTECSQVPQEVVQHQSHPQHPLVLLQSPPPPANFHHHHSDDKISCAACLDWIQVGFYLHCNHCPTFNLHLNCYVQRKPIFKHEAHEHPLAFFAQITYEDDVRCYACNTHCELFSFRCFTCNFNIHYNCLALPITVISDDHVDPLTLTTSFKENRIQTTYHCDICEKRRDPEHGIYFCKECKFVAHFECALSLSTAEEEKYANAHWRHQKIEEDTHRSDEEENMTLTNEKFSVEIFGQLNVQIEKLGEVIQQLTIKERGGEQLTEKLQELDERHAKTEDILRRLKQSAKTIGTNFN